MATGPRSKAQSQSIYHLHRGCVENTPKPITCTDRCSLPQLGSHWASAVARDVTNRLAWTLRSSNITGGCAYNRGCQNQGTSPGFNVHAASGWVGMILNRDPNPCQVRYSRLALMSGLPQGY